MLLNVKGLVIRTVDYHDNDKLITLFTEEKGIITVIASGSKTIKSRYMAPTELFCYSNYVLYKKGEYFWVREVDLIESFFDLRLTIERTALATYICDVINYAAVADMPDIPLLRLTLNSLYATSVEKHCLPKIKAAFEMRCASILGFSPDMHSCSKCNNTAGDFYLDVMNGNLVCKKCKSQSEVDTPQEYERERLTTICYISESAKSAIEYVINSPLERFLSFNLEESDLRLFGSAAEEYLLNHIGQSFKSLDFYKQIAF